jgi:tripartite-type tricarboxylate transporter receptor subunit TctC
MKKVSVILSGLMLSVALWSGPATAAEYPDKPITIVCWSSAGSGHDLMARMIAKVAEKYLGQPLAVVNKTGGQGKIAMNYVLEKKPDGYTIMTNTRSMTEVLTDPKDALNVNRFSYISQAVIDPFVVLVKKDSPFNTFQDLVNYAKGHPNALKIGGYSVNSVDELLVKEMMQQANIQMKYIPYKGGMEPVIAVLGGDVDVAVANPSEMISNYQAGSIKLLVTASENRFAPFESTPTLKELGFDVVEEHWRGLMASSEIPQEIINKLDDAFKKAINDPEFRTFLTNANMYAGYLPHDKFTQLVKKQSAGNAK